MKYNEYIKSKEWKEKRANFFEFNHLHSKTCYVCSSPRDDDFHVHHRTYKNFQNEDIHNDLVLVCIPCHSLIHRIEKEEKLSVWDATEQAKEREETRSRKEHERKLETKHPNEKTVVRGKKRKVSWYNSPPPKQSLPDSKAHKIEAERIKEVDSKIARLKAERLKLTVPQN